MPKSKKEMVAALRKKRGAAGWVRSEFLLKKGEGEREKVLEFLAKIRK